MEKITLSPIGFTSSEFKNPRDLVFACKKGLETKTISKIIINKEFKEGLNGLDNFSHLFIIYLLNKAKKIELKTHPGPPNQKELPRVGVFASRSQYRPNHLALRLVRLIKIIDTTLYVEGLDAINGSKILDIKPYVHGFDRPKEFTTAYWYDWLNH